MHLMQPYTIFYLQKNFFLCKSPQLQLVLTPNHQQVSLNRQANTASPNPATYSPNMKSNRRITHLFILLFCFVAMPGMAQNGSVKGIVTDGEARLIGATLFVEDIPAIGTITDVYGVFSLKNIPPGVHTLIVSYIGYEKLTQEITLAAGEEKELEIVLKGMEYQGKEVVITAQKRGQTQAINQQLNDDRIANIVSSDRIQELPDVNAAEAIGRLPGVSLNRSGGEGQKVVIRGLEPKFSAITINGVRLPSNSSTDRSVDLSLIAPELLDGIEVFKSPLPDMDAEALGGTVNLRIRKAPETPKLLFKGLGGYNDLTSQFRDYKLVAQSSRRFFDKKLGVIAQASAERFNRSGDLITYSWRQGRTDSLGNTEILGSSLQTEARTEVRRRYNGSLALDYALTKHNRFSLFGVYSRTDRDQFRNNEQYNPSNKEIEFTGSGLNTSLSLYSVSLFGEHDLGKATLDWSLSGSQSLGKTPYDFSMQFFDNSNPFAAGLNNDSHPNTYLAAANPNLTNTILRSGEFTNTQTRENTQTAILNLLVPIRVNKKISASFKVGGKYYQIDRARDVDVQSEGFYYLGGVITKNAAALYDGTLNYLPSNNSLISMSSFLTGSSPAYIQNEDGSNLQLNSSLDPSLIRNWYESQKPILNEDRSAIVNRYQVLESIGAGYAMLKVKFGNMLTVIPGFRYERSDNSYQSGLSTISGRYGVNGIFQDTTVAQQYGLFLPHLHIKVQPLSWLDVRASYAQTMARPDYQYITPRFQIDQSALIIRAGNPSLNYALSKNYDLQVSAYDKLLGLFTAGAFYKDITNIFIPVTNQLVNDSIADAYGWPGYDGYQIQTYVNLPQSRVWGFELDLQTYFAFLPKPLNRLVLNVNYTRLFSETQVFFLTSETKLIRPFPPIVETIYKTQTRSVPIPSQPPHILHLSLGYEIKKFSARVSGIYQGAQASSYSLNKDFDSYNRQFWRWDASIKQGVGDHISLFLNLNNISNQRDITYIRNTNYLNSIQTYGLTGTIGAQYNF